jgi:quercetin dioxygenase-like cupin family protein
MSQETPPRRILTGIDERGNSVFAKVEQAPALSFGIPSWSIWGSDGPLAVGEAEPGFAPSLFPGVGGVRVFVSEMPPGDERPSRLHASDTVDFVFVLSGTVWLQQGDRTELELRPGDCVVQTGTLHAWRNRGPEPARLAFVLLGVGRD